MGESNKNSPSKILVVVFIIILVMVLAYVALLFFFPELLQNMMLGKEAPVKN